MTEPRLNSVVQPVLDGLVAEGREIGVQVAAWLGEEQVIGCWAGLADPATGRTVDGDTLFNVFSVTKAVTATALHIQAERGRIDYDATVATYWPEFAAAGKAEITVRQVLSHVSGMLEMPADVTPERMCDWDWMARRIAAMAPAFAPGSGPGYQAMTFGWLVGEMVRRTDPHHRTFCEFVREEIAQPLGAGDLWLGIPGAAEPRVAWLDASAVFVMPDDGGPGRRATPLQVDLMPETFERPAVRRACILAVGGIFSARSEARFWAMLANGGTLGGVRLLSPERVRSFLAPRPFFSDAGSGVFRHGRARRLGRLLARRRDAAGLRPARSGDAQPPRNGRDDRLGRSRSPAGGRLLPQPDVQHHRHRRGQRHTDRRTIRHALEQRA